MILTMHKKLAIPFTKDGYEEFKLEMENLLKKRPEVVTELARARDLGDRSENAAYKSARWELSKMDGRLRFLRKLLENGKVMHPSQTEFVEVGSVVRVKVNSHEVTYLIVGEHEANPMKKKLSYRSPVGSALFKKKAGAKVLVATPGGDAEYEILEISIG